MPSSLLFTLPKELLLPTKKPTQGSSITSVVSEVDATMIMSNLSRTCKSMHTLFKPALQNRKLAKLAQHIEAAKQDQVQTMIKADCRLLFEPLEVTNKQTNQIIQYYTPLQLAYCEGDNMMCMMLKPYFEMACGSESAAEEEIRRQLKEKFAKVTQEENEKNIALTKNQLTALLSPLIEAISHELFNHGRDANHKLIISDNTLNAIQAFRNAFTKSQSKMITSGMRFRLLTLQQVFEVYAHQAAQWRFHYNKCALLEDAILSFVLRYVSKNDAQQFSQGLYYLQNKGEKFKRVNTTRDDKHFYTALRRPSADFSLSGASVDILFGGSGKAAQRWLGSVVDALQNLCRTKSSIWQGLCVYHPTRKRSP